MTNGSLIKLESFAEEHSAILLTCIMQIFGLFESGPFTQVLLYTNNCVCIGIKNGFSWIKVCFVQREVLKTKGKDRLFQYLLRDLALDHCSAVTA